MRITALILTIVLASSTIAVAQQEQDTEVKRGEYLVHHVAMCVYCHTPRDEQGNLLKRDLLSGAPMPISSPFAGQTWGFQAPNLRLLPQRWGTEAFIRFLKTGDTPSGYAPRLPMPPYRMTDEDARAIAAYLNSLPVTE